MDPRLTIKTRKGIDRVIVHFDPGAEGAAFDLVQRALPGVRELDRCVRRSPRACPSRRPVRRPRSA